MASEWALKQRAIQPRQYTPQSEVTPNQWRRLSTKLAKQARVSRRRYVKSVKRGRPII